MKNLLIIEDLANNTKFYFKDNLDNEIDVCIIYNYMY